MTRPRIFDPNGRGFVAIGLNFPKTPENVGGALRAAGVYGAALVVMTGNRFGKHSTDTMKAWRHIPFVRVDDLQTAIPFGAIPVAVEILPEARPLPRYTHPERAYYIFGPEDGSLGKKTLAWCRDVIYVPTSACMNLAATVNVVLYDRAAKAWK